MGVARLILVSALAAATLALASLPLRAQEAATFPVRVVVVTMFEVGADRGDRPGELQRWVENYPLPEGLAFPVGHRDLRYAPDRPAFVESYLQDFFGLADGPRLGDGPLVIELWAPNRRPLQVTSDLAGFWKTLYPALRRQLSRRYPKHAWPEDPVNAKPPERRRRR